MSKDARDRIGEIGEEIVIDRLSQILPDDIQICWTRLSKPNHPFDIILWKSGQTIACIEIKTLDTERKWYWTQFKRPAIKRKMEFAGEAGCGSVYTIAVKMGILADEVCWIAGLPSIPIARFESDLKKLVSQIAE